MARRESIILFGEGKTEAIFLQHLHTLYQDGIAARVKVDAGQGGSPKQVAERLVKKHLNLGAYDRSLLLIDSDLPLDEIPANWLVKHRITLVTSVPRCFEGFFLTMLGDLPPAKERHQSRSWKRRFHKNHLGTDRDAEIISKLRGKCLALFPKELIEKERITHSPLGEIVAFLSV